MKILVTGGNGLLAHHLKKNASHDVEILLLSRAEFDLTQPKLMALRLVELKPHIVINTAAYNFVDRCEIERDLSWAVNATAPEVLAELCRNTGIRLVHFGTDYVFDGTKKLPYVESDPPQPLNCYAVGKLAGERSVLRHSPSNLVLRTSWVFGWHPTQTKTFVHSILQAAREGRALKATTDQVSVPTSASDLAQWTFELIRRDIGGLFHAVNDEGVSRFDWAKFILEEAAMAKLIPAVPPVEPVLTSLFSPTMRRPDYTVMSNEKLSHQLARPIGSWRASLRKMLAQMK